MSIFFMGYILVSPDKLLRGCEAVLAFSRLTPGASRVKSEAELVQQLLGRGQILTQLRPLNQQPTGLNFNNTSLEISDDADQQNLKSSV